MDLVGNLDCEARWAGVRLPDAVSRRISLYAALFAACAPGETSADPPHQLWAPSVVDPARLIAHAGWSPPVMRTGAPPADAPLWWATPAARAANDRSGTLAIAAALGVALPGAQVVGSLDELDGWIAGRAGQPWVCKARWTAAGRDRAHGAGPAAGQLRARIARLFARMGPLVAEPWLDRIADYGVCGTVAPDGAVHVELPHRLVSDPRGGFLGIELAPAIDSGIAEALTRTAGAAAAQVAARTGYRGPFAIDAFVYRDPRRDSSAHHLHPLCEINARHSFGWIAHALAGRLGIRRLGFDAPPADATVLIAPGTDRVSAWCA